MERIVYSYTLPHFDEDSEGLTIHTLIVLQDSAQLKATFADSAQSSIVIIFKVPTIGFLLQHGEFARAGIGPFR